jgi:hypothetical protein
MEIVPPPVESALNPNALLLAFEPTTETFDVPPVGLT